MMNLFGCVLLIVFSFLFCVSCNIFIAVNSTAEQVANSQIDKLFLSISPYAPYINISMIICLCAGVAIFTLSYAKEQLVIKNN